MINEELTEAGANLRIAIRNEFPEHASTLIMLLDSDDSILRMLEKVSGILSNMKKRIDKLERMLGQ